jgi:hypothetical protein
MNIIDLVAIVAIFTLSILILSVTLLPFIAAMMHVTYIVNDQLLTGCIAAMSGIVSAIVMKKMQAGSDNPKS